MALDVLDPLRALASLEHRIRHRLSLLKQPEGEQGKLPYTEKQLCGYLARVREARQAFDEQLRQTLMEIAVELASTQEKIADLTVRARVGEVDFPAYRSEVEKLRLRREQLERRQVNVRGWLAVRSPLEAGGYIRLPLDHLPSNGGRIVFANEPDESAALVDWWIQDLREAMVCRERAGRKLRELDRLVAEGQPIPPDLGHRRADVVSVQQRAGRIWQDALDRYPLAMAHPARRSQRAHASSRPGLSSNPPA